MRARDRDGFCPAHGWDCDDYRMNQEARAAGAEEAPCDPR